MTDDHLQIRADVLAARVEALAAALRASGVSEETSAQLLSQASAAVLQALNLELLTSGAFPASDVELPPPASYCLVFGARDEPHRTLAAFGAAA
jgi:hypothetical protein